MSGSATWQLHHCISTAPASHEAGELHTHAGWYRYLCIWDLSRALVFTSTKGHICWACWCRPHSIFTTAPPLQYPLHRQVTCIRRLACIETRAYAHAGCMWHALLHSAQITHSDPLSEPKPPPCPLRFTEARSWVDKAALMPRQRPRSHGPPGDALRLSPLTSIRPILGCSGGAL